ncbi:hypothetical protein GGI09_001549, partial [Coemansia sp. S100]
MDTLYNFSIRFSGEELVWSAKAWVEAMEIDMMSFALNSPEEAIVRVVMSLLDSKAKRVMVDTYPLSLVELFTCLTHHFSVSEYESWVNVAIDNGSLFNQIALHSIAKHAMKMFGN